jgi:hypothetical protein
MSDSDQNVPVDAPQTRLVDVEVTSEIVALKISLAKKGRAYIHRV